MIRRRARCLSTRRPWPVLSLAAACFLPAPALRAQVTTPVPAAERGTSDAERAGHHDAGNIRTIFWNYGMVGDYPPDPAGVDLSVFHSVEVPKGSGMNYSDGITPFVLARIIQRDGSPSYIMETGFRERQGSSPFFNRIMRFEPRPGYFEPDPGRNPGRSPAISSDPRTWPPSWPDKRNDPDDPGWAGSWNGYFGKQIVADQESYTVMDDDYYDAWDFYPDSRDSTRRGLGLRIEVRGFQWANPQASNVVFWHYDITNEGTTDFDDNIIFGLYMDSGVGGSALSCDGIFESDDDNAFFDRTLDEDVLNLVYTWDKFGHGRDLSGNCGRTGYLGYAYMETPGNALDGVDNDLDGITDERREGGPGTRIVGAEAIRAHVMANYNLSAFENEYGPLEDRPAFRAGVWHTGDEDMDWIAELHDVGADGLPDTGDTGEGDDTPTEGEPNFDRTDLNESDQIGLTGFKINRIRAGQGNPDQTTDGIVFFTDSNNWPQRLYEQFTHPDPAMRFDRPLASNYNIGFLFASGPFQLPAGKTERFSLALAYGGDLNELRRTVKTVQQIYDANYRFAVPPPLPTATAEAGDGYVRLSWDSVAEKGADPVTGEFDFEGYRIYRSTDPEFRDPKVITTGTGSGPLGNGRPIAQFDLDNGWNGFSTQTVEGVAYYLGDDAGLTHTWTDTTVTNGQAYYYAVCAYDRGSESFDFYPSENAIAVSRTPRGGLILPQNAVFVRPNPRALGYVGARADTAIQVAGRGSGDVRVAVVNSDIVPEDHLFKLEFHTETDLEVRATSYSLTDSTTGEVLFTGGTDLAAEGIGAVGRGLLPLVTTPATISVNPASGFRPQSPTNTRLRAAYQPALNINLKRPGFPDDLTIQFSDTVQDTSLPGFGLPAKPARFRVLSHPEVGAPLQLDFQFRDEDNDGTLSRVGERIDIVTYAASAPTTPAITWRVQLDTLGQAERGPIDPPAGGDTYDLFLDHPLGRGDVFVFSTRAAGIDETLAREQFRQEPYVVPNPYVASASFEPERFAVSGRGDRRLEFRGLPATCTIRIYTVKGDLVQTLRHEGSDDGYLPWDLRTKDNLDVAPGLFLFHVDAGPLGTSIGKFAIIK
jgi:hypothetical protein